MKKLRIGMIGLGQRGASLLEHTLLKMEETEITAVCDEYADRAEKAAELVKEKRGNVPFQTTDYREVLKQENVDAVIVSAAWEAHVDIAVAAMYAGKYVGLEVGGGYAAEDCWKLVNAYEATGSHCMMLENCCYGRYELMCLNMIKNGILGEIAHCDGRYSHELRKEITSGEEIRHYRLRNYMVRNCDNYPTHDLGPIAKMLDINNGNRMMSLVSVSSKAVGLNSYMEALKGAEHPLAKAKFAQGDIVTTLIKCANGETISLTLDTTLPRTPTRGINVHGTKGYVEQNTKSVFLEKDFGKDAEKYDGGELDWADQWGNIEKYESEYLHPLWKWFLSDGLKGGHGGMDWLTMSAFVESALENAHPPIDVYDAAAWMSISVLSEESIALGGHPVVIPDFTRGKWIKGINKNQIEKYRLDALPEIN